MEGAMVMEKRGEGDMEETGDADKEDGNVDGGDGDEGNHSDGHGGEEDGEEGTRDMGEVVFLFLFLSLFLVLFLFCVQITFYDAIFFFNGWIHILSDYITYKVTINRFFT